MTRKIRCVEIREDVGVFCDITTGQRFEFRINLFGPFKLNAVYLMDEIREAGLHRILKEIL